MKINNKMLLFVIALTLAINGSLIIKNLHEVKEEIKMVQVATETKEKMEPSGQCGNPVNYYTRVVCAEVVAINEQDNILTLVDEDGETWVVEVGNAKEFDINWYYCIFFDTMGTTNIYDDEVVKLWREVW